MQIYNKKQGLSRGETDYLVFSFFHDNKKFHILLGISKKSVFLPRKIEGLVAEWLGTGLQNR